MKTELIDYNLLEKKQARKDGATLVPNSGRGQRKGDARLGSLLIDYKFTKASSYSINLEAFRKHQKDAWRESMEAVVVPVFTEHDKQLAIVDWELLKDLLEFKSMYEGLCK